MDSVFRQRRERQRVTEATHSTFSTPLFPALLQAIFACLLKTYFLPLEQDLTGEYLPLLWTRKQAFEWLEQGKKTIDIRKGKPHRGEVAVFESGPKILRLKITKRESGKLRDIVRQDNFSQIIPSATKLEDAVNYVHSLYGCDDDVFTAYYVASNNAITNENCGKLQSKV